LPAMPHCIKVSCGFPASMIQGLAKYPARQIDGVVIT
jgi:hypothetical protein